MTEDHDDKATIYQCCCPSHNYQGHYILIKNEHF